MALLRLFLATVCMALRMLAATSVEAIPLAHREVLDNGAVLLVAERPPSPSW